MTQIPRCPECNAFLTPSDSQVPSAFWQCWNGCGRAYGWAEDEQPKEDVYYFNFPKAPRYAPEPREDEEEMCAWVLPDEDD